MQDTTFSAVAGGAGSPADRVGRQPLPLTDPQSAERLKQPAGATTAPSPGERDHEDATWYRLVTALSSCYSYVTGHTDIEPVRFVLASDGTGACYIGSARRWEVVLTPAAHRAFPVVVELWHAGALNHCYQVVAIDLGEATRHADDGWSVEVLPAVAPDLRTRTVARG